MKFVGKNDIEAPIETVFEEVSDFEGFQRSAVHRGVKVVRVDELTGHGPGMTWDVAFDLRGRRREMKLTLADYEPRSLMRFNAASQGVDAVCVIELLALSRTSTRLRMAIDLKPQNLSARLLVQSLKLAKSTLTKRLEKRLQDFGRSVEDRARRRA